jgi:aryl-alcohol dehydrogenase-like predicted oxidoreductase
MRKVELVEGIYSSVLGFGCAPMLGAKDRKTSSRSFELAMELGVNHFDLARSYGYGEAEKFVGNIIKDKRDKVILTSKFGIQANWKASLFRSFKPIFRSAIKSKNTIVPEDITLKKKNHITDLFLDRIEINTKNMKNSLEKSLKALKTDYLDFFLIHEPVCSIYNIEDIIDSANRLKKQGKIRAFGLSFTKEQAKLHEDYLTYFDLLQFNNSPCALDYENVVESRGAKSNIIFSPLNGGSEVISPDQIFKKLYTDFPKSVILCSMFNENHLIENIKSTFLA